MIRVWLPPLLVALCGTAVAAAMAAKGDPRGAGVFLPVFVLLAVVTSPLVFPRSISESEARRRSALDGRPVVFWRPGCTYCLRLRLRLGRLGRRAYWVDIWRDAAGAAAVRAVNGGDETVPTVMLAGHAYVNPDPGWVRERLSSSA
ncbi:glutaredoxin domain-containing protein [Streptomyces polyrhachis]|uniref:Glutaredoxin domain-containing protein n=1 Tax=Streptomyces polyrhachis TaxID=1282885 RepID=A0ABW2GIC5_9ACTN